MAPESDLVELTDETDSGDIDQDKIDAAISHADELIDGYLRGRYDLPLSPVPGLLRNLSADIALFRLYKAKFRLEAPEAIKDGYTNAIKLLENIQKGTINLGAGVSGSEASGNTPATGGVKVSTPCGGRIFDQDKLRNF